MSHSERSTQPFRAVDSDTAARNRERRILVVDDDSLDRRILRDLLASSALTTYTVTEVGDQEQALLALSDIDYDVCLVDYYLGRDQRGTDLIATSLDKGNRTPFIVLTGSTSPETDRVALEAGAVDFLAKDELTSSSLDRAIRFACRQAELLRRITEQAACDPLTGLANRTEITRGIEHRLSELQRSDGGILAVLYLDLDGFKRVNDTLGHSAGDLELQRVASVIRSASRGHDLVGRHGGDEFVIAARFEDSGLGAVRLAERICAEVSDDRSGPESVGVSVGVATTSDPEATAAELLWQADLAMYQAKDAGRGRVQLYDEELRAALVARISLERDLLRALDQDKLSQAYQPVFNLETRAIVGFEALARWEHPEQGPIDPNRFVAVAQECGASRQLTRWSLNALCRTISQVTAALPTMSFAASINVGVDDLGAGGLCEDVLAAAGVHGVDPSCLIVEIAEGQAVTNDCARKELLQLVDIGVGVAIDDFGTGFSSLSKIHELPLTHLKLDRSFVASLDKPGMPEVVATIHALARSIGVAAVAEGIETEEQLRHLADVGFRLGQGYLVSGAMSSDDLLNFLREATTTS